MGDEGHNRNKAGSLLYLKALAPHIAHVARDSTEPARRGAPVPGRQRARGAQPGDGGLQGDGRCRARRRGQHHRHDDGAQRHRLWDSRQRPGRPLVHRACRGARGPLLPGLQASDANPDIGDSTITETAGIGAFAMAAAPAIVTFVSGTPARRAQRHAGNVRDHRGRAHSTSPSRRSTFAAPRPASTFARWSRRGSRRASTPASPTARPASGRSARGWSARRWRSSKRRWMAFAEQYGY